MRAKYWSLALIIYLIVFGVGCWDKAEINNREFLSAVGIDQYSTKEEEKNIKNKQYIVTGVYTNLNSIGKQGEGEPSFIYSSIGRNPSEVFRQITTRSNKTLFYGHLKAFIMGEEIARDSKAFKEIIDNLERDPYIGRRINILISKGKAKDVLGVKPRAQQGIGNYIFEIVESKQRSARMNPQTLDNLLPAFHTNGTALIPKIMPAEDEIKIEGSAIIKNYRLIGWLNGIENRGIMFIKNEVEYEDITIVHNDVVIPYMLTNSDCKKNVYKDGDNLKAVFNIETEGFIDQYQLATGDNLMNKETIHAIEKSAEEEIKRQIRYAVNKVQEEFKTDVIDMGDYLSKYKPSIWDEVKDDWEQKFQNMEVEINVIAKIRRIGMVK